jgi:glucokinase
MAQGDAAAAISAAALAKSDRLAQAALDLFARLYGAQAGNLALTVLATGGVYIAGGIAAKILDKLRDGAFMKAFLAKGRMSALLADMPVRVVINTRVGLLGAALAASRL